MATSQRESRTLRLILASIVAGAFGVLTIWEGGSVLVLRDAARDAGQYVRFVVLFNFVAGFAYVLAGFGLWFRRAWAPLLAALIASATVLVFIAFGLHIAAGGGYEVRTVVAMSLRFVVWTGIALIAYQDIQRRTLTSKE